MPATGVFHTLDAFTRHRLRDLLFKQRFRRPHFGFGMSLSRLWPNAFFARAGLLALETAWQSARQSR